MIGSIAANWGLWPPNLPFPRRDWDPCLIQRYLGPHKCLCQMASRSIRVHKCDRQPDRQTYIHTNGLRATWGNICRSSWNRWCFQQCHIKRKNIWVYCNALIHDRDSQMTYLVTMLTGVMSTITSTWCPGRRGKTAVILSSRVSWKCPTTLARSNVLSTSSSEALRCATYRKKSITN